MNELRARDVDRPMTLVQKRSVDLRDRLTYHPAMRILLNGITGCNANTIRKETGLNSAAISAFLERKEGNDGRCVRDATVERIALFIWRHMNAHLIVPDDQLDKDPFMVYCANCHRELFRVHRADDPIFRQRVICEPSCEAMALELSQSQPESPSSKSRISIAVDTNDVESTGS